MPVTKQGSQYIYVPQGCLYFAGGSSDDFVEVVGNSLLEPTDNLTLSVWMKPGTNAAGAKTVINYDDGLYSWCIRQNTVVVDMYEGRIDQGTAANQPGTLSHDWHHLVLTFDKSLATQNVKFYIDGKLEETENDTGAISYGADNMIIGAGTDTGGVEWQGYINDIRFYSGNTLSASEIKQLYNGINITEGMVAHWKFDDKKGTTLTDSVNALDGTLTNGPTWADRDIRCWNTRWDEQNYNVIIETFMDPCDRNYLMANVIPGAVSEMYTILGKPKYIDTTYSSSNTLIYEPLANYGLLSLREKRVIGVKNISDNFSNWELFNTKIEGKRLYI